MKKIKLAFAMVLTLANTERINCSSESSTTKEIVDSLSVIIPVLVLGTLYYFLGKDKQERLDQIMNQTDLAESQQMFDDLPESEQESINQAISNKQIPEMDNLNFSPDQIELIKKAMLDYSTEYLNITNQADLDAYQSIIGDYSNKTLDEFGTQMREVNYQFTQKIEAGLSITDALQAVKADMQAGSVPDIPQVPDAPVTVPSAGTGTGIQPAGPIDEFNTLQTTINQQLGNLKNLDATQLATVKDQIVQQIEIAKAQVANATDDASRAQAEENLEIAQKSASEFNQNKPAESGVDDITIG